MVTRALLVAAVAALLASCSSNSPQCSPVTISQASVQGDTITTTTGLRYIDLSVGTGTAAAWCQGVSVHYEAFNKDGTLWDTSDDLGGPFQFVSGFDQVFVKGLEQGVIGMKLNGSRRLIVPPALGFGNVLVRYGKRQVLLPPNSTLIFDVQLVSLVPPTS